MYFKVLLRSLPDVREQLAREVQSAPRPLVVAQEHEEAFGGPFARRLPYRHLLEQQAPVSVVVVADDPEGGLWRDPVGELAERLFPDRRQAAEAASGYILFPRAGPPAPLRRDLWDPWVDVRHLARRLSLGIAVPPPAHPPAPPRPRFRVGDDNEDTQPGTQARPRRPAGWTPPPKVEPAGSGPEFDDEDTGPLAHPPAAMDDPFKVLGLSPTCTEAELKKAFRELIVQYHPDKVAHLAAEFRELAEKRTRELTSAYDACQRLLRGEPREGA